MIDSKNLKEGEWVILTLPGGGKVFLRKDKLEELEMYDKFMLEIERVYLYGK